MFKKIATVIALAAALVHVDAAGQAFQHSNLKGGVKGQQQQLQSKGFQSQKGGQQLQSKGQLQSAPQQLQHAAPAQTFQFKGGKGQQLQSKGASKGWAEPAPLQSQQQQLTGMKGGAKGGQQLQSKGFQSHKGGQQLQSKGFQSHKGGQQLQHTAPAQTFQFKGGKGQQLRSKSSSKGFQSHQGGLKGVMKGGQQLQSKGHTLQHTGLKGSVKGQQLQAQSQSQCDLQATTVAPAQGFSEAQSVSVAPAQDFSGDTQTVSVAPAQDFSDDTQTVTAAPAQDFNNPQTAAAEPSPVMYVDSSSPAVNANAPRGFLNSLVHRTRYNTNPADARPETEVEYLDEEPEYADEEPNEEVEYLDDDEDLGNENTVETMSFGSVITPATDDAEEAGETAEEAAGEGVCVSEDPRCTVRLGDEAHERCYSADTHVCVDDLICPRTAARRCGNACYDARDYVCHDDRMLCPAAAPAVCGDKCHDDKAFRCLDGKLVRRH